MRLDSKPRTDRVIVRGTVLVQGVNLWRVHHADKEFCYVSSEPRPEGEAIIPLPWSLINGCEVQL
jgi:hypothetical protein